VYARITIETASGNRIDIVETEDDAVSSWFILNSNLKEFVDRIRDMRVKKVDMQTIRILQSEGLISNTVL